MGATAGAGQWPSGPRGDSRWMYGGLYGVDTMRSGETPEKPTSCSPLALYPNSHRTMVRAGY